MKEKHFQTEFGKRNKMIGVFELKFCKGKSLPFSALAEHQEKALLAASSSSGLYHKISDFPMFAGSKVRFNSPKPFDCVYLSNMDAYVVIMWWVPRKKKNVYYLWIRDWIDMRNEAGRKSATEEMADSYACRKESYLKR
jgi:hypothetical protein